MNTDDAVKKVLDDTLQLRGRSHSMTLETPLLGSIPELDSMAILHLISGLEEQFGFSIPDDEIDAEVFATLGSLVRFVDQKQSNQ